MMFRLGACVKMMKITRGFQSLFVMATLIQAWYVWVVTREIRTSRKLCISNWEWAPWYGSYGWRFCSYDENSRVIVEIALEFLRVVTKKLDSDASFVKTTNLLFLSWMSFKKGSGYTSEFLDGKDMKYVLGACGLLVQLLFWKKLIGTFITIVKPQQVNVFMLDLGWICMLECYVTMRPWRRLDNFKERIWKNSIQHMPVVCYAMIALVIGRYRKQIPMSLLSSYLIVK